MKVRLLVGAALLVLVAASVGEVRAECTAPDAVTCGASDGSGCCDNFLQPLCTCVAACSDSSETDDACQVVQVCADGSSCACTPDDGDPTTQDCVSSN